MTKERGMPKTEIPTDAAMTLDTAVDLAENYVTKIVTPFEKVRDVLRVARDAKNLVPAYEAQVVELDGRIAALQIEEAAAIARVANANARAETAEAESERVINAAALAADRARAEATRTQTEIARAGADRLAVLEADYTARKAVLDEAGAVAQRQLETVRKEYDELVAAIRSKFGPG